MYYDPNNPNHLMILINTIKFGSISRKNIYRRFGKKEARTNYGKYLYYKSNL